MKNIVVLDDDGVRRQRDRNETRLGACYRSSLLVFSNFPRSRQACLPSNKYTYLDTYLRTYLLQIRVPTCTLRFCNLKHWVPRAYYFFCACIILSNSSMRVFKFLVVFGIWNKCSLPLRFYSGCGCLYSVRTCSTCSQQQVQNSLRFLYGKYR